MRKGLLSLLLFVVVGLSAVQAAYDFSVVVPSGQTLYFSITSNSAPYEVGVTYPGSSSYPFPYSGYTEPTGNLVIPDTVTYQGISYSVTSIGNYAFEDCSGLTSVTIPNSVTSIGSYAFDGCTGLISVTIPNSVTSIGNSAFRGCSGLTSVTIPNSVTSIGSYAFYNVRLIIYNGTATGSPWGALLVNGYIEGDFVYANNTKTSLLAYIGTSTSVTIPNSVTSIGEGAFYNCSGLTSVTIPNSVTSIGDYAFSYCSGLTSVTIPNSVTSIGWGAFKGCSGLTSVTIPNSVTTIGSSAFMSCSSLTTLNFNAINCNNFNSDSYYYPFKYCPIATINIGDSVQRIPAYFAYNLESLTSVTIPNSVTSIGNSAFYDCDGLTSVTIPNSVISIGNSAFYGCSGLTTLNFNAINCGDFSSSYHPFYNCPIATINIGDSVQQIPAYFAYNLDSLTSITIPNSVTSIGNSAFYGCSGLTTLNFNAINCGDFTSSDHPFSSCPISTITIGDSVQRIPAYFAYDRNALTSITIPNSVTYIGYSAFYDCSGLTSVTIGNSVTSIGYYAFRNCSGLTSVTIPNYYCPLKLMSKHKNKRLASILKFSLF